MRNAYKILVRKADGKRSLEKGVNIKFYVRETRCDILTGFVCFVNAGTNFRFL